MRMEYNEKANYLNSIKSLRDKYKDIIKIETDKIILGQHFIYDLNGKLKFLRSENLQMMML